MAWGGKALMAPSQFLGNTQHFLRDLVLLRFLPLVSDKYLPCTACSAALMYEMVPGTRPTSRHFHLEPELMLPLPHESFPYPLLTLVPLPASCTAAPTPGPRLPRLHLEPISGFLQVSLLALCASTPLHTPTYH